jgi:hypothetical protein
MQIKTDKGTFGSIEGLLAFDRKIKHETAKGAKNAAISYAHALEMQEIQKVETIDGEIEVPIYFFDSLSFLTVLDTPGSCAVIEVEQQGLSWGVAVGYPARFDWWYFNTLNEALAFAADIADRIDRAEDPEATLKALLDG